MRKLFVTFGLLTGMLFAPLALPVTAAAAVNVFKDTCTASSTSPVCADTGSGTAAIDRVIDLIFYTVGIVAVIVIIVGGIKFITADGDASKIKGARETIMYAVIGLVVALLSYGIVGFIIGRL